MGIGDLVERENKAGFALDFAHVERRQRARLQKDALMHGLGAEPGGQGLQIDVMEHDAPRGNVGAELFRRRRGGEQVETFAPRIAQGLAHGVKAVKRGEFGRGAPEAARSRFFAAGAGMGRGRDLGAAVSARKGRGLFSCRRPPCFFIRASA